MKKDIVYIYCDGACRNNQEKNNIGAYATVLHYNGHKRYMSMGFRNVTNNQMEMAGVIAGLEAMKKFNIPTEVHCDSAYIVNAVNKGWLDNWAKNGWVKRDGKEVKNQKNWTKILELIKKFDDITFVKVKGHSDNIYNEEVDKLANLEMDRMV